MSETVFAYFNDKISAWISGHFGEFLRKVSEAWTTCGIYNPTYENKSDDSRNNPFVSLTSKYSY